MLPGHPLPSPIPFYVPCLVLALLVLRVVVVVVFLLLPLLCSQVLLIQKIGSIPIANSELSNVLHLMPGVGQINIAMHASITRCLKFPPFSFLTFSVPELRVFQSAPTTFSLR